MAALAFLLGLPAFYLRQTANPWRLQLVIPSGLNEADFSGWLAGLPPDGVDVIDVEPELNRMAISRPDGVLELWTIEPPEQLERIEVFPQPTDGPGHRVNEEDTDPFVNLPPHRLDLFADGQKLLYKWGDMLQLYVRDLRDGSVKSLPRSEGTRAVAVGPNGQYIAYCDLHNVYVYDLDTDTMHRQWRMDRVNGGRRGLDWSPDGSKLLLNDAIGLRVWDVPGDKLLFMHRELDLRLDPPMLADETSGLEAPQEPATREVSETDNFLPPQFRRQAAHIAQPMDSRFVQQGRQIVCAYRPGGLGFPQKGTPACRLRTYDAKTGALLKDEVLSGAPQRIVLTTDGEYLLVSMREETFTTTVAVFRLPDLHLTRKHTFKPFRHYPTDLTAASDARWVAAWSDGTWMIDLDGECAPIQLGGAPNVLQVEVSGDGQRVIEAGMDKTVRVFDRRRRPSKYGAWALPVTWCIHAISIAGIVGLVFLTGRTTQRQRGEALPKALWGGAILVAIGLGWSVASGLAEWAVEPVYTPAAEQTGVPWIAGLGSLLLLACLIGTMSLRAGWRRIMLLLYWLALGVLLPFAVFLVVAAVRGSMPPLTHISWHGRMIPLTTGKTVAIVLTGILWPVLTLWLLHHRTVRRLFSTAGSVGPDDVSC